MGQIPQGADGMPGGPMPGFFQSSPHHNPNMMDGNQPFMSPRYPGGPRGPVRMPGNQPAVGAPNSQAQAMMQSIDPSRQPGHPSIMGPRMNHPRMPMNPNYGGPGMRAPLNSMPGGMPMSMPGGRPWNPNAVPGPPGGPGGGPPGTPIMPSPQDSSNSGDSMFSMMKSVPGGAMGPGNFPMNSGPDGPMPMGSQDIPPVMNGEMDGMPKSSPASNPPGGPGGPGTPREDNGSMTPQMFPPYAENCPQDQNESAAILKIKETMQEEAKRFEKDTPGPDHPEYFMQ
eukprot:XP_011678457.1 PREDICTED: single-stranded DNA-binding protein 3 isoform X2 [Strongylocentrotus purpuratus]